LLSSAGVADTYTLLRNTWNTLPESNQQMVYNNTLAIVKCQIQHAENPTPTVEISEGKARVEHVIHLDYLTSEVGIEEPEFGSTGPNIQIDNNSTDNELHFRMAGGSGDLADEGDQCDANPTGSRRRQVATELENFDLGSSDVDGYEGQDGDDADGDEEEEASQAEHGSTQNVEY
jgi:hypothetical protein